MGLWYIVTTMDELIEAFEANRLANHEFHHRDHVRMAWTYLREYGFPSGAERFVEALRRFAAANGKPQLYHATITWAYLVTISDRMARHESDWETFAAANSDLFTWKPSIIDALYDPETIASEHAKRVFVLPDRSAAAL
ncbi:MAG TPA: hypothetical protein VHU41_03995 [Thermoanaerobaculia bacterium]|nr:hypothetical protein [Thermoanaerobaculia bacterium]